MELFAVTGILFWVVAGVSLFLLIASVEYEAFKFTTVALIVSALILIWLGKGNPIDWLMAHREAILLSVVGYLVIGVIWGIVKWFFYLMQVRDLLVEFRTKNDIVGRALTIKELSEFKSGYGIYGPIPPEASRSKARSVKSMIYWPFSMPWTLVREPVTRFFTFMYNRIAGLLQGMSKRLFRDLV